MTLEIPSSFDSVDVSWVRAALTEGADAAHGATTFDPAAIDHVDVEVLDADVGFLGQLARITIAGASLTPDQPGHPPSSMMLKLPTTDPGGRTVGTMLGAWSRESLFYDDVAPAVDAPLARCLYNGADHDRQQFALLLEAFDHQPPSMIDGAGIDQVEMAVDGLAQFQRSWWDAEQVFDWMPGFDRPGVGGLQQSVVESLDRFGSRYAHLVPSETLPWLARYAPSMYDWVTDCGRGPLTIAHADYRTDNLLFANDAVIIIDWQTALRGPGPMDLASLLATSLTIEDRRRHEDDLVARYADAIGVASSWVSTSYRSCLLWWMAIFANNLSTIEPDAEGQRIFDTMIERTFTAAADHEVNEFLN